jgi:acyl-coenzyme A synthetase/AMP-(fatty) acid ligase
MEERLRAHAWIKEACTVALPGRRQNVGALLVLTSAGQAQLRDHGRHAFAQQLRKYLGHWFDAVLLPRRWRYRDSLPYNERGKLVAADIIELFGEKVASHE